MGHRGKDLKEDLVEKTLDATLTIMQGHLEEKSAPLPNIIEKSVTSRKSET